MYSPKTSFTERSEEIDCTFGQKELVKGRVKLITRSRSTGSKLGLISHPA